MIRLANAQALGCIGQWHFAKVHNMFASPAVLCARLHIRAHISTEKNARCTKNGSNTSSSHHHIVGTCNVVLVYVYVYEVGERDRERERMRKVNVSICIISFRSAFMCSCVLSGVATKSWTLSALFVQSMRLCIHATMCRVYFQFNFSLFVLLYFKRSVPRFSPFFGFMNTSKYLHAQYGQIVFFLIFLFCSLILFYVYDHHP